jgi:hypothetical protein
MSDFTLADAYGNPFRYVGHIKSARVEELSLEHDSIRHKIYRLNNKMLKSDNLEQKKQIEIEIELLKVKKETTLSNLTKSMLNYRIKRLHLLWVQCVEELCGSEQLAECIAWLDVKTQENANV